MKTFETVRGQRASQRLNVLMSFWVAGRLTEVQALIYFNNIIYYIKGTRSLVCECGRVDENEKDAKTLRRFVRGEYRWCSNYFTKQKSIE